MLDRTLKKHQGDCVIQKRAFIFAWLQLVAHINKDLTCTAYGLHQGLHLSSRFYPSQTNRVLFPRSSSVSAHLPWCRYGWPSHAINQDAVYLEQAEIQHEQPTLWCHAGNKILTCDFLTSVFFHDWKIWTWKVHYFFCYYSTNIFVHIVFKVFCS